MTRRKVGEAPSRQEQHCAGDREGRREKRDSNMGPHGLLAATWKQAVVMDVGRPSGPEGEGLRVLLQSVGLKQRAVGSLGKAAPCIPESSFRPGVGKLEAGRPKGRPTVSLTLHLQWAMNGRTIAGQA